MDSLKQPKNAHDATFFNKRLVFRNGCSCCGIVVNQMQHERQIGFKNKLKYCLSSIYFEKVQFKNVDFT